MLSRSPLDGGGGVVERPLPLDDGVRVVAHREGEERGEEIALVTGDDADGRIDHAVAATPRAHDAAEWDDDGLNGPSDGARVPADVVLGDVEASVVEELPTTTTLFGADELGDHALVGEAEELSHLALQCHEDVDGLEGERGADLR